MPPRLGVVPRLGATGGLTAEAAAHSAKLSIVDRIPGQSWAPQGPWHRIDTGVVEINAHRNPMNL